VKGWSRVSGTDVYTQPHQDKGEIERAEDKVVPCEVAHSGGYQAVYRIAQDVQHAFFG